MASEVLKTKKRKGATDVSPKPKKQKSENAATTTRQSTKALKAAIEPVDALSTKSPAKVPRPRAQDFFEPEVQPTKDETAKERKYKKGKRGDVKPAGAKTGVAGMELDAASVHEKPNKVNKSEGADAEVQAGVEVSTMPAKKAKKSKKGKGKPVGQVEEVSVDKDMKERAEDEVPAPSGDKKLKKENASKKAAGPKQMISEPAIQAKEVEAVENEDSDEADQTAALLAGFESDGDDADPEEDADFDGTVNPAIPQMLRNELNKAAKNKGKKGGKVGVIFVGRLPHGFFEPQMKAYFSQFGTVTRLRLSRNKKTGASKHFAFVEFASEEVAQVVAKTMDKYLLFGHILQCKIIPEEQVHVDLFKGANARFKVMPRNKIAGSEMKRGAERMVWERRVERETKKRASRNAKLIEQMDYEFTAPPLKAVDDVPMKEQALEDDVAQQLLIEAADQEKPDKDEETNPGQLVVSETVRTKKPKKGSKAKPETGATGNAATEVSEKIESVREKRIKKDKKPKVSVVAETKEETKAVEGGEVGKVKKTKKAGQPESVVEETIKEKKRKAKAPDQDGAEAKKVKKAKKVKASVA
ncbi:uncharacterized protein BDR25DRAFT_303090 [Lindgomyces ingoldianus]|uniref:Uncharacterized protein n=1 Tax=Lindgomyces ingoldianus TaxID=673940 RepID=A0ACB6QYH5_9PLEO|nr:uncharacterized protein BDR25DRAFT_303090 [Lindgomyces ingoldianus]KAF2471580.1 hypothetical protein BDR25DRAFT_303090 [Lindgomyces ingoldianus]